jgi:hypothetical protein
MTSKLKSGTTLHIVSNRVVALRIISVRGNIVADILLMQLLLLRSVRRWVAILEQFLLENTAVCMIADANVKYMNVLQIERELDMIH